MKIFVIILCLVLAGCGADSDVPGKFSVHEKVHYIDDANLTGRILSKHGSYYYVQWLAPSEHGIFTTKISPFSYKLNEEWELVSMEIEE